MGGDIEYVGLCLLLPTALTLPLAWLGQRLLPTAAQRYVPVLPAAVGFAVGYALLPDWAPLAPARHWQWLPHLGLAIAVVGAAGVAGGVAVWERWLLTGLLAVVAAWQLVPTWETLQPPRTTLVPLFAAYLVLLSGLITALPDRLLGRTFASLLAATAFATVAIVAVEFSVKIGQVGAIGWAVLASSWAFALWISRREPAELLALRHRALVPLFVLIAGGVALAGAIEPDPPRYELLLLPAAPLSLSLVALIPVGRLAGAKGTAIQLAAVLVPLAAVAVWIVL